MENNNSISSPITILVIIVTLLCCCCIILTAAGFAGMVALGYQLDEGTPIITPGDDTPFDFNYNPATPTPVNVPRQPVEDIPTDTLATLENTIVPANNPRELACRLGGVCNIPETAPSGPYQVGDEKKFWVTNSDNTKSDQVTATLRYATEHSYFWVQNSVRYNENDLKKLADAFETQIYPTNRAFFGPDPGPGIDEDPHIYILYTRGMGSNVAGYFSSADAQHPLAHEYSNAHEMFLFNADNTRLGDEFTYGVLAHEFQHMIHWNLDRNETSWLNEGFSELASLLNGYDPGGFDWAFLANPDLQLTDWPNDSSATTPHYGAGFLFTAYFLDRFGEEATQTLVRNPQNGMDSVDDTLAQINASDPLTNQAIRADDLFIDWAITNYLNDSAVSDSRYAYQRYRDASTAKATETIKNCPVDNGFSRTVNQYGTDYIRITCNGTYTLRFEGATETRLLPASAYSGKYAFWSNKGDESNMTLTREFDFSGISGPIQMTYQTWYDIESDYDYLYLLASTNNGQSWEIITTPSGTGEDPSGNAYGWGYNGQTGNWKTESIDLSRFAGQKTLIRFEYVTDAAVNGEGFLLDDVSIAAMNYTSDFESDDGGWQSAGFVRIENRLPQTFRLAVLEKIGSEYRVRFPALNPDQSAEISLEIGGEVDEIILIVSGTTRFTREDASYSLNIR